MWQRTHACFSSAKVDSFVLDHVWNIFVDVDNCSVLSAAHRRSVLDPGQAEADLRKARAAAERAGGPKLPGALLQFMDDSREVRTETSLHSKTE